MKNYTLSSPSFHSGFLEGSTVNINVAITRIIAETSVKFSRLYDPLLATSINPPIQMIDMKIGRTYFTIINHHLPNLIVLLLSFKKLTNFSAFYIQANKIHSTITPNSNAI